MVGDANPVLPILAVNAVSKRFDELHVLNDISFHAQAGEFLGIVGPSGSGKTTLLKILGGLLRPTSGRVELRGAEIDPARHRKGEVGFVFQNPVLLPWRTAHENIRLPLEILRKSETRSIASLLSLMGLDGFGEALPSELSGGMKQRVAIARALVFDPSVLLMDEPFGAVDELTRGKLNIELMRIWSEIHTTVVFVTHSVAEAVLMSDRIVVLSSRPASVKGITDINLARPRSERTQKEEQYLSLVQEVRDCLEH